MLGAKPSAKMLAMYLAGVLFVLQIFVTGRLVPSCESCTGHLHPKVRQTLQAILTLPIVAALLLGRAVYGTATGRYTIVCARRVRVQRPPGACSHRCMLSARRRYCKRLHSCVASLGRYRSCAHWICVTFCPERCHGLCPRPDDYGTIPDEAREEKEGAAAKAGAAARGAGNLAVHGLTTHVCARSHR